MYTADQADIDPRNPANHTDADANRFLIDANQFNDEQAERLVGNKDIDVVFESEAEARTAAFIIARTIYEPVHIDCGTGETGDYDWFDCIIVKPEVKVA